jgi:hypothetical protein
MEEKKDFYGRFVVSKNILEGESIRYSVREQTCIPHLNGWTLYSLLDEDYEKNPQNFVVITAADMAAIAPIMLVIADAPYGTDLSWQYKDNMFTGFYDLVEKKTTSIEEIMNKDKV